MHKVICFVMVAFAVLFGQRM